MDWPLKIQGRLLSEKEVNQIRILLRDNPSWNRSRLSRELCRYWNWQRPDGQLKDMACRELLRKLEFRSLIKLPPRQRPGPGQLPIIEPTEVDRTAVSCMFSERLSFRRKPLKTALKKLGQYFGDHSKFQYKIFRKNGLPTGSGTVESAIRRVINLRVKGAGMFWKRENAEKMFFLRSLVLTGKLKTACRRALGIVKDMFANNALDDLCIAA